MFDANAFCEIEEVTGMGLQAMVNSLQDKSNLGMKLIRAIIYGGISHSLEDVSQEKGLRIAGDVISDAGMEQCTEAINSAMSGALPGSRKAAPNRKKAGNAKGK